MSYTLYKITTELQSLLEAWETAQDMETDEALGDWFLALAMAKEAERNEQLEQYFCAVQELQGVAAARRAEGERLLDLAKQDEAKAQGMINRVKEYFETHGIKRVDTVRFPLRLVGNGGVKPLVMDEDGINVEQLDERFIAKAINAKAVRQALEAGETLEFATLGERGTHLEWKGRTKKEK